MLKEQMETMKKTHALELKAFTEQFPPLMTTLIKNEKKALAVKGKSGIT